MYNSEFKGALNEFETALDKFRDEDYSGAIIEANKSFEGTMKSIMDKKKISYTKEDKIRDLLSRLFDNNIIIDTSLKDAFDKLINILESGLPTIRNQGSVAHTQGLDIKKVEKSYAEFALNLAGSYIVFLINRYEESK